MKSPLTAGLRLTRPGLLVLALTPVLALAADPVELRSLRGSTDLVETSRTPDMKRWEPDQDAIPRDYVQQPPLIPHKIEGYKIDRQSNKCLSCHSWSNYKEAGATKVSPTHFRNRNGVDLANVSASRYFCTQCHVPQTDARPLVRNEFQSVEILQPQ